MIDKQTFSDGMGILAGAFGREVDPPVSRAYYATLSPQLATEEFVRAVELAIAQDTYWPSPARLLEHVGRAVAVQGDAAFDHVRRLLNEHGGHRWFPIARYQELDDATKAGIKAAGGLGAIALVEERALNTMRRAFREAFTPASITATPALAGVTDHKALAAGDRP